MPHAPAKSSKQQQKEKEEKEKARQRKKAAQSQKRKQAARRDLEPSAEAGDTTLPNESFADPIQGKGQVAVKGARGTIGSAKGLQEEKHVQNVEVIKVSPEAGKQRPEHENIIPTITPDNTPSHWESHESSSDEDNGPVYTPQNSSDEEN